MCLSCGEVVLGEKVIFASRVVSPQTEYIMDYIEIHGYKSIRETHIEIAPINILIGANGTGKSNLMSFFDFVHNLYERNLQDYIARHGGEDKFVYQGLKRTRAISFDLSLGGGAHGYRARLVAGTEGLLFSGEQVRESGQTLELVNRTGESILKVDERLRSSTVRRYLEGLRKYHFHDTSPTTPFARRSHIEHDTHYLYADGSNIAAYLYHIRELSPVVYHRIVGAIQAIAPYFLDFYLQPSPEGYVRLYWRDRYSDITYSTADLSDGTLRFVALAVLFLQPVLPPTIIIDEPELGLHPFAITKLAGMIASASDRGAQVIAATQSAELISHFAPEDVLTVDHEEGASTFRRLSAEELGVWLEGYESLGSLWRRGIISKGQPNM